MTMISSLNLLQPRSKPVDKFAFIATEDFNKQTHPHFFQPFTSTIEELHALLTENFPRLKQAANIPLETISVMVAENIHENLRKFPATVAHLSENDPNCWGAALRYRLDRPWYLLVLSGKVKLHEFGGYNAVPIGSFPVHVEDGLPYFVTHLMWASQQDKFNSFGQLEWRPIDNIIHALCRYFPSNILSTIHHTLLKTEFFFSADSDQDSEFTLERATGKEGWQEVAQLSQSCFHAYHNPGLQDFWGQIRKCKKTQIWLARSRFQPEPADANEAAEFQRKGRPNSTVLGFLLAGVHPISDLPTLFAVAVLPDERRRGIATSLIRRFFSQSGYKSVSAGVHMGPSVYEYEGAGLLKSLGAELKKKGQFVWLYDLKSPTKLLPSCES